MPKSLFNPHNSIVTEWPEIFEDLYVNTVPISYLECIRLEFNNGRIWEIDVKGQLLSNSCDAVTSRILETFREYQSEIVKLDFKIDIFKMQNDISDQTNKLL